MNHGPLVPSPLRPSGSVTFPLKCRDIAHARSELNLTTISVSTRERLGPSSLSSPEGAVETVYMVDTSTPATLEGHLHTITGARNDYDSLFDLVGDRGSSLSARPLTGRMTSTQSEPASPVVSSRSVDSMLSPWRQIGPTPTGSTATSWGSPRTRTPTLLSRTSSDSQPGCGGTAMSLLLSNGFALATTSRSTQRSRPASTVWISTASELRWKPLCRYLDRVDPNEAARARSRYSCFDHVGGEGQAYGYALAYRGAIPCENEVVRQLIELRRRAEGYLRRDGWVADDEYFFAEQNALLVRDAEEYYQQMYRADVSSWNLRDRHMAATLDALSAHLDHQLGRAKVVVWEHNSHVGDARSTEMGSNGELNVGQLVRQRYAGECVLIGFTTHRRHRDCRHRVGRAIRTQACASRDNR